MVETNQQALLSQPPPPPPPPLPPSRSSVLQRFIAPLTFGRPQRPQDVRGAQSSSASPKDGSHRDQPHRPPPPRTAIHRTEASIAAIDLNQNRTHAILAGRDILKTVKVQNNAVIEDLDIRGAVNDHISTQQLKPEDIRKRREYLPAKDVRWSNNDYSHVIATAAQNGRIALYDASTLGRSRVELAWLYQHTGEVNKIDFDPFSGYMLLSGSQDRTCKSWDIRDPRKPAGLFQYDIRAPVRDVRWAPTDAWIFALCTEGGVVQKWDVRNTHQPQMSISAHEKSCYTIAWHPDGKHLASGGVDKHLRVWDLSGENRRQKPVLQLRAPHGIMNLAWRPPCWSAEFARAGTWQSTQIGTTYTEDDPRVHIWDLRRPLIPFRELNQNDIRPRDLLWASKNLLWTAGGATVGRAGMFVQNDVTYAANVEDSLPPGAQAWSGDRSLYAVIEDRSARRSEATFDPAADFLNVPQDRLSGTDEGALSHSPTDDEGSDVAMSEHSRRQSKAGSTRSMKSQANTPPNNEDDLQLLPLDRAIKGKKDLFINGQVGATSLLSGIYSPSAIVAFLANNYARALTSAELGNAPDQILSRLENAFLHNAKVCDVVSMQRSAQTWRILAAVIIPELKQWADTNRARRLTKQHQKQQQKEEEKDYHRTQIENMLSPFAKSVNGAKSPARPEKLVSSLFRGMVDAQKVHSDIVSTSNMTTPLARPIPSLNTPPKKEGSTWFTLDDGIEPIQPLPPSLANAHSTAAAASRVLLDNSSDPSDSLASSPEKIRSSPIKAKIHKRSATESLAVNPDRGSSTGSPVIGHHLIPNGSRTPLMNLKQDERRAALRDYKATSRQPFSLEPRPADARIGREDRHDSSESFAMFSASTSSSAKARSFRYSLDTPDESSIGRKSFENWDAVHDDSYDDSIPKSAIGEESNSSKSETTNSKEYETSQTIDFAMDESPQLSFGVEEATELRPAISRDQKLKGFIKPGTLQEEKDPSMDLQRELKPDQTNELDAMYHGHFPYRIFHHQNPFLNQQMRQAKADGFNLSARDSEIVANDVDSYHFSDFGPFDITLYQTPRPFALSAWSIICQVIAQDIEHGMNSAQLSVYLLSYIHSFFFHQSSRIQARGAPTCIALPHFLADKLMNPMFSARIVEGIFASHIEHLQRLKLYLPASYLRKFCVEELGHLNVGDANAPSQGSKTVGDALRIDHREVKLTCSYCKSVISSQALGCGTCSNHRDPCPICQVSGAATEASQSLELTLHAYCHICGHSAHLSCMSTWLSLPGTEGECPTPFCGCDCGPGLIREQRIARQYNAREEDAEIRASTTTATANTLRKDPVRVTPSPAVDRARESLRKKSYSHSERETQSGDENRVGGGNNHTASAWSKRSHRVSGASRGGIERSNSGSGTANYGGSSLSRKVRVVEPDR